MDEGGTRRFVLKHRDGVVVGCAGELGAALGEAPYVLVKALPGLLFAVAQLPLLAKARVCAPKVANKDQPQVSPVLNIVAGQVLEPLECGITEVEW
jgi:hypothetical protein